MLFISSLQEPECDRLWITLGGIQSAASPGKGMLESRDGLRCHDPIHGVKKRKEKKDRKKKEKRKKKKRVFNRFPAARARGRSELHPRIRIRIR